MDYITDINGKALEYFDAEHVYLYDGIIIPSITQILKCKFGNKYAGVSKAVLKKAAEEGTRIHDAIERYCMTGEESQFQEVRNFQFLQKRYKFEVLQNEVPVVLYYNDEPIAAGRLDLVLSMNGQVGGADIKRTSVLDKEYLAYQLNLYRIAYRQSYGVEWEFLRGIHLRNEVRKFVKIPINENLTWAFIHEYLSKENEDEQS